MSIANSIHHSNHIYNYFKTLNLGLFLSDVYLNHLMAIILSVFLRGYRGKTVDFQEVSHCHRTTTAYFLNHGKWDDIALQDTLKRLSLIHIFNCIRCAENTSSCWCKSQLDFFHDSVSFHIPFVFVYFSFCFNFFLVVFFLQYSFVQTQFHPIIKCFSLNYLLNSCFFFTPGS